MKLNENEKEILKRLLKKAITKNEELSTNVPNSITLMCINNNINNYKKILEKLK